MPPLEVKYVTTQQAATQLGVTRRWIRKLIVRGEIKATMFGRDYLISDKEFRRYQASRKKAAAAS